MWKRLHEVFPKSPCLVVCAHRTFEEKNSLGLRPRQGWDVLRVGRHAPLGFNVVSVLVLINSREFVENLFGLGFS